MIRYTHIFIALFTLILAGCTAHRDEVVPLPDNKGSIRLRTTSGTLNDIANHWAKVEISALHQAGYVSGYQDGTFRPDNAVTRAELAALITAIIQPAPKRPAKTFTDVDINHWAFDKIMLTYQSGFMSGFPDGSFRPNASVTRAQLYVALANGLTMSHKTHYPAADYYQDAHQIPTWARANVMSATVNNLVANYPNKKYIRASKPATRGEVAVAFYRILAAANKQVYTYQNPYLITCAKIPPVLMYHEIIDQPKYSSDVSTANFGLQMQWLHQAGYTTLKLDEFYEAITQHKVLPEKSILITFDDVYIGNYTIARPILQQYNMQAAFFAHTAFVGASTGAHAKMNWAQLAEMHQLFEVESHTHTHQNLAALSAAEINQELSQSQIALRDRLNKNSRYITYPYGGYNAEVLATAANYYAMGFAVAFKGFEGAPMAYSVPRIPVGTGVGNLTTFKALIESYDY